MRQGDGPGMVIVGAGEAGARAALALREQGWDGPITLIGEEKIPPYERPPLSKAAMVCEAEPEPATILARDVLAGSRIDFMPGHIVARIDRAGRHVVCDEGRAVPYLKLLLATGARPRRLAVEGAERALYLRHFADALALRAHLRASAHLVVVGGGFIGLEIAASAVARGCCVTVLEAGPRILGRGVPEPISAHVAARHRAAGVDLRTGVTIDRISEAAGRPVVMLADGADLVCDAVIAGVGAAPETTLAAASGLAIDNGVWADARLQTSDPDIFAAGDCCSFPASLYDGRRLRLEAWRNARAQGELAASNMLGADIAYDAVPWFWSDQYEQTIQVAGLPDAGVTTVARPAGEGAMLLFHLAEDGRLVAASGVGPLSLSKDIRVAEMLIAGRAHPDPASLASGDVRLRTLLNA